MTNSNLVLIYSGFNSCNQLNVIDLSNDVASTNHTKSHHGQIIFRVNISDFVDFSIENVSLENDLRGCWSNFTNGSHYYLFKEFENESNVDVNLSIISVHYHVNLNPFAKKIIYWSLNKDIKHFKISLKKESGFEKHFDVHTAVKFEDFLTKQDMIQNFLKNGCNTTDIAITKIFSYLDHPIYRIGTNSCANHLVSANFLFNSSLVDPLSLKIDAPITAIVPVALEPYNASCAVNKINLGFLYNVPLQTRDYLLMLFVSLVRALIIIVILGLITILAFMTYEHTCKK